MAQSVITNNSIRIFLQDKPQYNSLLDGVRWSDEMINEAVLYTVSYYNESNPPTTPWSVEAFPYFYTLLTGVAGYLLKSASIQQASSHLTYQGDAMTVDDNDKAEIFAKLGADFWAEFTKLAFDQKTNFNLASAYGSVSSEWAQRAFTL